MIPKSSEIRVEVINSCNYNCVICRADALTRPPYTMNYDFFKYLLDTILMATKQYKVVAFAGMGEPLLDGGLDLKINYAKEKGLRPLLITNGYLLDVERFLDLQEAGLYSVRISFHGGTPEGYAALHNCPPENFTKIKNQIHEIATLKKRKTKLLMTCIIVDGVNDCPIKQWTSLWEGKVDRMEIWRAHNWVNAFEYRDVQAEKLRTCGRIDRGPLQIQVDGTVNACCFDCDGKLVFGDLKENELDEIFESDEFNRIKKCHDKGKFKQEGLICENCDQRNASREAVLIYSSDKNTKDRVNRTSTAYDVVIKPQRKKEDNDKRDTSKSTQGSPGQD